MPAERRALVVVGGGIVGLATACELKRRWPRRPVIVLEAADEPASGQTARNSGVVHAGIYYRPGSLKARLCVTGAQLLTERCERLGLPLRRSGKLIVARNDGERARLDDLLRRARLNGVPGVKLVDSDGIAAREPACTGIAALWSPATAVTDFRAVAFSLAHELAELGGELRVSARVRAVRTLGSGAATKPAAAVALASGARVDADLVVACAGADADRLALASGLEPDVRIVPFRGAYLTVAGPSARLVRGLIYPVPDPRLPFLGVHLSRHVDDQVTLGPTALPWPSRALPAGGVRGVAGLLRDARDALAWPGTVRALWRHRRAGLRELRHALFARLLVREARTYVPGLDPSDFRHGPAGVRAQAVARDGTLIDDFVICESEAQIHVLNAPSPAATSALALARLLADRVAARLR